MRGRAAPPHQGIYRVPPPHPALVLLFFNFIAIILFIYFLLNTYMYLFRAQYAKKVSSKVQPKSLSPPTKTSL